MNTLVPIGITLYAVYWLAVFAESLLGEAIRPMIPEGMALAGHRSGGRTARGNGAGVRGRRAGQRRAGAAAGGGR
ncbi:MAG: hypothetical protein MZV70_39845 [Desulfobacterales bacterium]|nr:hypothetical protein [Desulfobacterales bacterium]